MPRIGKECVLETLTACWLMVGSKMENKRLKRF